MIPELYDDTAATYGGDQPAEMEELDVRRILIAIGRDLAEIERLRRLKAAVAKEYDDRIDTVDARVAHGRYTIKRWLELAERSQVTFPDVGAAHLRKVAAKVEVTDEAAFEKWARENAHLKEVLDLTRAKQAALRQATETGVLADGIEVVPGGTGVTVRFR